MPLTNLTQDADEMYFLDGLHSELTTEVGRYQDIIAVPCAGAVPASDTPDDMKKLAATLGVRFVLGGTLRKDAKTAKVTLHLTDAATGRQVWSDAYKERIDANSIIATQERIARDVVTTIAGELGVISQRLSRESRKKPPAELTTYEAMLRYHHYMRTMTTETYMDAMATLQTAVEHEPEYGPAWSALANLFNHAYVRDASGFTDPLDTATEFAQKGAVLEPGNQLTRTIMAYVYQLRGDRESVSKEAGIALALNPNSPYFAGTIGYVLIMSGDFERGRTLIDKAIALNPCHPRWFHHARWVDDYQRCEYEASYREALMADPKMDFWNPAILAASLGQLGRESEAEAFVGELRRLKPDFEPRARELITRVLKIEDLVERIIDGLRKAGLEIS
jgi:adenylate cyclase